MRRDKTIPDWVQSLRVGDTVAMKFRGGFSEADHRKINQLGAVERLTATQVIIRWENRSVTNAYRKHDQYLNDRFSRECFTQPTDAEIEEFRQSQASEKTKREAREAEKQKESAEREALQSLFGDMAWVNRTRDIHQGEGWTVTIHGLSEEQVRDLARKLKGV